MEVVELHRRATESFGERVAVVRDDQWHLPTPNADWDVRQLVNHVVSEQRWAPELLAGRTIDEVGDRLAGDLLGDDPRAAWEESAKAALATVCQPGATERTVHLSFGDSSAEEYLRELSADLLVHGWDLARGVGADEWLDPELVTKVAGWFTERESMYRRAGVIAPRVEVPSDVDAQTRLLAAFGRANAATTRWS